MFLRLNEDGIQLAELVEMEFQLLRSVSDAANYDDFEAGKRRLFPNPVQNNSVDPETGKRINKDWQEFITPELESRFRSAIATLESDLNKATESTIDSRHEHAEYYDLGDDESLVVYNLDIPRDHADEWCSALNQARLVLNEKYDLAGENILLDEDPVPDEGEDAHWYQRIQSNFYALIQEYVVEMMMEN